MRSVTHATVFACLCVLGASAQQHQPLRPETRRAVEQAVREAFAHLLALPRDTDGAKMGTWVVDSAATLADPAADRWTIVVNRLSDIGEGLKLAEEMSRQANARTPQQLADAAAAVAELEKQIARLESDATFAVDLEINGDDVPRPSNGTTVAVTGATRAWRAPGAWVKDQWHPGVLMVRFEGTHRSITIRAQGNDDMIERLIATSVWSAFTALLAEISSPG